MSKVAFLILLLISMTNAEEYVDTNGWVNDTLPEGFHVIYTPPKVKKYIAIYEDGTVIFPDGTKTKFDPKSDEYLNLLNPKKLHD